MSIRLPSVTCLTALLALAVVAAATTPAEAREMPAGAPVVTATTPAGLSLDALLAATPAGTPDTDADGLPDPVEAVLGTMDDERDSDADGVDDLTEIRAGLDPDDLDTNGDGLPDGLELSGPADVDGDKNANALDADNDNDGVRDGLDLSPFAASAPTDAVTVNLRTKGHATHVDFQVTPTDADLLRLVGQQWDWPVDRLGTIQDLHDIPGEADVQILPMLELLADTGPDAEDVSDYGVIPLDLNTLAGDPTDGWKALVPLSPVFDSTGVAALQGTMFYPYGAPAGMTVKLVWALIWIDPHRSTVALVDNDVAGLAPGGTLLDYDNGQSCTIAAIVAEPASYLCQEALGNGAVFSVGDTVEYEVPGTHEQVVGTIVDQPHDNLPVLARYKTPFVLTGLAGNEAYDAEVAVVSGDPKQVMAAALVVEYEYLRGAGDLTTLATTFAAHGLTDVKTRLGNNVITLDDVLTTTAGTLVPTALDTLPGGTVTPVIITYEEDSTRLEPIEWRSAVPAKNATTLTLDLRDPLHRTTTRNMRLDWYDPATQKPVADFISVLETWDLDDDNFDALALLAAMWAGGESLVTTAGGNPVHYEKPEWYTVSKSIADWSKRGFTGAGHILEVGLALNSALDTHKFIKALRAGDWHVSFKGESPRFLNIFKRSYRTTTTAIASTKVPWSRLGTWGKVGRSLKFAAKAAAVIGYGVTVAFVIHAWVTEGFDAAMYELLSGALLIVVGELLFAGWIGVAVLLVAAIVLVIGEIFGGWASALWDWLFGSVEETPLVDLDVGLLDGWPVIQALDTDDNGFDVGDDLVIRTDFMSTTTARNSTTWAREVRESGILPRLAVVACARRDDGSVTCMPSTGLADQTLSGDEADLHVRTYAEPSERWYYPASLETAAAATTCQSLVNWNVGERCSVEYLTHALIEVTPKLATTDLTLNTGMAYTTVAWVYVDNKWPSDDSREIRTDSDDGSGNRQPLEFDVLPPSVSAFDSWSVVAALDWDHDGLIDNVDTHPYQYDFDGDGLSDGYEIDLGTDVISKDTDGDTIEDAVEVGNGTFPNDRDSDDDKINDNAEATGWPIQFTYFGKTFNATVTSDPMLHDADGDTLNDDQEKLLGTNPNAWDTDGDGFRDGPNTNPTAANDSYTTDSYTVLSVSAPGLLGNDIDDEEDPIRINSASTSATLGKITWASDGAFKYDPNGAFAHLSGNETATDTFSYTLGDGRGGTDTATVTITISAGIPPGEWFTDDDGSIFEADIEWLAKTGITRGCNPPVNDMFCPNDDVTRGQMAAFLVRALGLTDDGGGNTFVDDDTSIFENDIARLAAAGITRGCNPPVNDRYCPEQRVTRGQMAAFLVRALGYTDNGGGDLFVDDNTSIFETDIDKLATAGVTRGCNPPANDRYCPDSYVTRAQMAAFLHRALG